MTIQSRPRKLPSGMSWKDKSRNRILVTHYDKRLANLGLPARKSRVATGITEAKAFKLQLIQDAETEVQAGGSTNVNSPKFNMTLKQAIDLTVKTPNTAEVPGWGGHKSLQKILVNARCALEYFGDAAPVVSLDETRIRDWIKHCAETKGNSPATLNRKKAMLSVVLNVAEDAAPVINGNRIYRKPKMPRHRVEGPGRIRILEVDDFKQINEERLVLGYFSAACDVDAYDTSVVLLDTGMRPSELWRTKIVNVNFTDEKITIDDVKDPTAGTSRSRKVGMTKRVVEIFKRRSFTHTDRPFPFTTEWFNKKWNIMRDAIGYNEDEQFTPYCLRHTCCSRIWRRTKDPVATQQWMGHKNFATTLRYIHNEAGGIALAQAALNKGQVETKVDAAEKLLEVLEKHGLDPHQLIKQLSD